RGGTPRPGAESGEGAGEQHEERELREGEIALEEKRAAGRPREPRRPHPGQRGLEGEEPLTAIAARQGPQPGQGEGGDGDGGPRRDPFEPRQPEDERSRDAVGSRL